MLLRNVNERLQIISRKDCKSEAAYNQKLFKVRLEYMQKFKSIILIKPFGINSLEQLPLTLKETL
jgi:hypothetical protein